MPTLRQAYGAMTQKVGVDQSFGVHGKALRKNKYGAMEEVPFLSNKSKTVNPFSSAPGWGSTKRTKI